MDEYSYLSFFEHYYNGCEELDAPAASMYVVKERDIGYVVLKNSKRLFFPVDIRLYWMEDTDENLLKANVVLKDVPEVRKILAELVQHLEVLKTTVEEILEKLAGLTRHHQLIKYMKKVINMIKKDLRSLDNRLGEPYSKKLALLVDALTLPYEELKNYFRSPGAKAEQRLLDIIASMNNEI